MNSPLVFSAVRVTRSLVLCVCFVDRCMFFFFWPLCFLFFFDIRILINPLVSSNSFFHKKREWPTYLLCKKNYSDSTKNFSEADIINILLVLIDNILVMFDGRVFHQTVGIPMGTSCANLLVDLFLYSYDQVG